MRIREERRGDEASITALVTAAFLPVTHSDHTEQHIVDALRAAGALTLSLVAEVDGALVGHVALSPVTIDRTPSGWLGLGPLAVHPDHQRRGVGAALMQAAIDHMRRSGAPGCVLLGSPAYYRRFGFEPAAPLVLPGAPQGCFQALFFSHRPAGDRPAGVVNYHEAFAR